MPLKPQMGLWELSSFGQRLGQGSGIFELMEDLGHALASGAEDVLMLGGGQPAHIPEMDALWRARLAEIMATPGELEHVLGNYEPPAGNTALRKSVADLFGRTFGWPLSKENVGVTSGGQTAFFLLFNALAGRFPNGQQKKILLPLIPEYIGYADQSVGGTLFESIRPKIERFGDHDFKYRVDFENLKIGDDIAAICVSRPTNPTGNVLTDDEITKLSDIAEEHNIPLIIDNAYGAPFPGIIFTQATPTWTEHIILTLSLSKLGLPGTRTGIVIADTRVIDSLASMTSIAGLANGNVGQAIVLPMIESGEILQLGREVVRPFYRKKAQLARAWVEQYFDDSLPYRVHKVEGALFLWIWFEGLPITSRQLYERLKERRVLVVPGSYFFFGQDDVEWRHRDECLRINFTMPQNVVQEGIRIIGEEVARVYRESKGSR